MMRQSAEGFTSGDEGVEDDLSSVEEISELSLPDGKQLGLCDAHAIFESQHRLLRQRAVAHLNAHSTPQHAT